MGVEQALFHSELVEPPGDGGADATGASAGDDDVETQHEVSLGLEGPTAMTAADSIDRPRGGNKAQGGRAAMCAKHSDRGSGLSPCDVARPS
ncbi:hypothetical protein GCM10008026_13500 [Chelatococcus composti]|nr:hypothetical protein GCM10008026_13500 [Chelatococcus composti]